MGDLLFDGKRPCFYSAVYHGWQTAIDVTGLALLAKPVTENHSYVPQLIQAAGKQHPNPIREAANEEISYFIDSPKGLCYALSLTGELPKKGHKTPLPNQGALLKWCWRHLIA
ncbi:MAG: hypothetical protein Kow0080_33150 [Candidatus Promineifilaceae bacterium]